MTRFCDENEIPVWTCGKLIVATDSAGEERLTSLEERGIANHVEGLRLVGKEEIEEIEPHVVAKKALFAPCTSIVDPQTCPADFEGILRPRIVQHQDVAIGKGLGVGQSEAPHILFFQQGTRIVRRRRSGGV